MTEAFTGISELVSPRPGPQRRPVQLLRTVDAALLVREGQVIWVGPRKELPPGADAVSDLGWKAVIPGLTDPHTHLVWAGDRLGDFERRHASAAQDLSAATAQGIAHTQRCTARAPEDELLSLAGQRLLALLRSGTTTVEIKTGYGGDARSELRLLAAIRALQRRWPGRLLATLLFHLPMSEAEQRELLQGALGLAQAADVYCERGAYSVREAERLLGWAKQLGYPLKLHADQYSASGASELAVRVGALSADHLEASGPEQVALLAASQAVCTLLPAASLELGLAPAPAGALLGGGAVLALGSDLNPGSAPCYGMQLAGALALRSYPIALEETLAACTVNAAAALGLRDRGALVPGQLADFLVLQGPDWRELFYPLGQSPVERVYLAGVQLGRLLGG